MSPTRWIQQSEIAGRALVIVVTGLKTTHVLIDFCRDAIPVGATRPQIGRSGRGRSELRHRLTLALGGADRGTKALIAFVGG
jgi:hypothetical protein